MRSLLLDDDGIRDAAHHLADFLVAYEQRLRDRRVSPELDRNALQRIIVEPPPAGARSVADLFAELDYVIVPNSTAVSHGRFLAYVLASPTNLAPIAEAVHPHGHTPGAPERPGERPR